MEMTQIGKFLRNYHFFFAKKNKKLLLTWKIEADHTAGIPHFGSQKAILQSEVILRHHQIRRPPWPLTGDIYQRNDA